MTTGKISAPPGDPVDLDFTGHFDAADLRTDLTPAPLHSGPVVSPDLLIGADTLVQNHYFVNVFAAAREAGRQRRCVQHHGAGDGG